MNDKILLSFTEYKKELETLGRAILKAESNKNNEDFEYFRDSVIQRYEYTIEGAWKLIRIIMNELKGIKCYGPKDSLKAGFETGYLKEDLKIWFNMINARNLTSHTYCLDNADMLYNRILRFQSILISLLDNVKSKLGIQS